MPLLVALLAASLPVLLAAGTALGQSPAGAFAGKTVTLIIGFGPGGGYDI